MLVESLVDQVWTLDAKYTSTLARLAAAPSVRRKSQLHLLTAAAPGKEGLMLFRPSKWVASPRNSKDPVARYRNMYKNAGSSTFKPLAAGGATAAGEAP
ncbi:MAG: hypothetical protein H6990_04160 [Pseudomonadales bacterium]|nr:hypothetical protein [Pseudomonadales bacterium]